jgi:DNA replication protein DnaC
MMNQNRRRTNREEQEKKPDNVFMFRLPQGVFERMGGKSTAGEVLWTCENCGETPKPKQYPNGFIPGKCACQLERARLEHEAKELRELQERRATLIRANRARCFNWLGENWAAVGMDKYTFASFDSSVQSEAVVTCLEFANVRRGNLVLHSYESFGTGKTHLAVAICNYLLEQGVACNFTTGQNLFNAFGARMDEHQGYSDLLAIAGKTPLLVIDDLDKVVGSAFKQSIFFEVLNLRWQRELPTVITTNTRVQVTPTDVLGISEYIGRAAASRLCDEGVGGLKELDMTGEDYRRRKLENRQV